MFLKMFIIHLLLQEIYPYFMSTRSKCIKYNANQLKHYIHYYYHHREISEAGS